MTFELGQVVREIGGTRIFTVFAVPDAVDSRLGVFDVTTNREYRVDASLFEVLPEPAIEPTTVEPKKRGRPPKAKT